ncbi:hypothetical protein ACRPK6_00940 [Exiguobacterium sp. TRN 1102]|uniref:hypothetical protein n=1 Tax=Exiguobacterium sp. TRN 1102 TaxID=3420732 RepID=UPI003D780A49
MASSSPDDVKRRQAMVEDARAILDMERQMGRTALILGILWIALFSLFQFDWSTVVETILIGVQLLVTINADGWGEFFVNGGSVSIYTQQ